MCGTGGRPLEGSSRPPAPCASLLGRLWKARLGSASCRLDGRRGRKGGRGGRRERPRPRPCSLCVVSGLHLKGPLSSCGRLSRVPCGSRAGRLLCWDSEKEAEGNAFIQYIPQYGGQLDPLTMLIEMDNVDEFRMLSTQIESARTTNVRAAEVNLGYQPRLAELQEAIRVLRQGGEIEAAEAEHETLIAQKQERMQRYDRNTLRRTLRAATEEAEDRCKELRDAKWQDAWHDPAYADQYLEAKMRHRRRMKLQEKLSAASQ